MDDGLSTKKLEYYMKGRYKELLVKIIIFSVLIFMMLTMNKYNNLLFHSTIEIFSCVVFFIVFVLAYNTYSINKNKFLMILGIGYFFVAIVDMLHAFTHPGVSILYSMGNKEIATELWITARYISVFTCLVSTVFIFKQIKKFNMNIVYILYCSVTFLALFLYIYF